MDWNRSETVALATNDCAHCQGLGMKPSRGGRLAPCNCVFRGIFRICFQKFQKCVNKEKHRCRVTGEVYGSNGVRRIVWGRKDEEYIADFYLVTRRNLSEQEWQVFNYHFLLGADWKLCCSKLKMDKGSFFHMVYRIQHRLGRVFREIEPYPLFPLDEYFRGSTRHMCPKNEGGKPLETLASAPQPAVPLRPPLRPALPLRPAAVRRMTWRPEPALLPRAA